MALITIQEFALKVGKSRSAIRARIEESSIYPKSTKEMQSITVRRAYLYDLNELEKIKFYPTSGRPCKQLTEKRNEA